MAIDEGERHDAISLPPVSEASAAVQISIFTKTDALECRGGTVSRKRRTREKVSERRDPAEHVAESMEMRSPLGERAQDGEEAACVT